MGLTSFYNPRLIRRWLPLAGLPLLLLSSRANTQITQKPLISNSYLQFYMDTTGAITLYTAAGNPSVPNITSSPPPYYLLSPTGSRIYFRVDGGATASGFDYTVGDTTSGAWLTPPVVVGNRVVAQWITRSIVTTGGGTGGGPGGGGGGGGGTGTTVLVADPQIEIDISVTLVHDSARFEYDVVNRGQGSSHNVGVAFLEDIVVSATGQTGDGPLRLPNGPYLSTETLLTGNQIPAYYETFDTRNAVAGSATNNGVTQVNSIRGSLRPTATSGTEPTPPTRLAYGRLADLLGNVFDFQPDTTINLVNAGIGTIPNAAVGVIWDEQPIAPTQKQPYITYVGQARSNYDFGTDTALSLTAPTTLATRRDTTTGKGQLVYDLPFVPDPATVNVTGVTPVPLKDANGVELRYFPIVASLTNLTGLLSTGGGFSNGPYDVQLVLPSGLSLIPTSASGYASNVARQTISSIADGTEATITWYVYPNGKATGVQTISVQASTSGFGNGKFVQRDISLPAPLNVPVVGSDVARGVYEMITIPLQTGITSPSDVLYPNRTTDYKPPFIARYNSKTGNYENVTSFKPGYAYWYLSALTQAQLTSPGSIYNQPLDITRFQPYDITGAATTVSIAYDSGWQQIGNPYLYAIRASDIIVFDKQTGSTYTMSQATDPVNGIVRPYVYFWNTSDPNSANWHYDRYDNMGFDMQPFEGYWFYILKDGVTFRYPSVSNPDAGFTRAHGRALASQPSTRVTGHRTPNDWRLRLEARGASGYDPNTTIGVSSKASDDLDNFKASKPPTPNRRVSLDIIHEKWTDGRAYSQDVRSASPNSKTWDMTVTSGNANEDVTLTWPAINASVPRSTRLILIDQDTKAQVNLRNVSSYLVNTGANATRHLQVVAEPTSRAGGIRITNLTLGSVGRAAGGAESAVSVSYNLSHDAEVQVLVRDGRGRIIRSLPSTRAASGSGGQAIWDLRNQQGAVLPAGQYTVELVATGDDGQRVRQIVPYVRTR